MSTDWQPTASIANLKRRAELIARIRAFFAARGIWEVDTPVLSRASITDVQLAFMETRTQGAAGARRLFLQTSPEFPMKRLLCAGSGAIYQIAKVFRDDECGRQHNPEFTMLEWYRPGFDHHQLMDEMDALLQEILHCPVAERLTYADAFTRFAALDCFALSDAQLNEQARIRVAYVGAPLPRDSALQLLFAVLVEPQLGRERPCFICDFPASQAALARVRATEPPVASRFEVYIQGMELANGFHELSDAAEQRRRFESDNAQRRAAGKVEGVLDEALLAALQHGLPDCAGVALGVDRLLMLALKANAIDEVLSFAIDNA